MGIPEVNYHVNKAPPVGPIFNELIAVHIPTPYFFMIYLTIILPSTPGSPM
jgi:hypothetical protein